MKKLLSVPTLLGLFLFTFGFASCSDSNDSSTDEEKETEFTSIVSQFVDQTVIVTYNKLADETIKLHSALVELKENKTDANVKKAAQSWKDARNYWELSEAFLFGPADDFGIDPHIDTWPLAKDALLAMLKDPKNIEKLQGENGEVLVNELEAGLQGFHGLEYIFFEEGTVKSAATITNEELVYAVAVAGDLRNQCFRLEASWAGKENVTKEKRDKLTAMGMTTTFGSANSHNEDGKYNYGYAMKNPGSTNFCRTYTDAVENILAGCADIADEVGAQKIGQPHTGADVNYIESPYSYNSKIDFIDNIKSIENVYLGGFDTNNRGASISDYLKIADKDLDTKILASIKDAIEKIDAIPFPFAKHYADPKAQDAIDACNDLQDLLQEAIIAIRR